MRKKPDSGRKVHGACAIGSGRGRHIFKHALVTEDYRLLLEGERPAHSDGTLADIEQARRGLVREALGEILHPVLRSIDTDRLVPGGQIAKAHAFFLPYALPIIPCRIVPAQGGTDTALLGVAYFCMFGAEQTIFIVK